MYKEEKYIIQASRAEDGDRSLLEGGTNKPADLLVVRPSNLAQVQILASSFTSCISLDNLLYHSKLVSLIIKWI